MFKRICIREAVRNERGLNEKESRPCGYERHFGVCSSTYACKFKRFINIETKEISIHLPDRRE